MNNTHTPGPWIHGLYAGGHQASVYSEVTGLDVALVYNPDGGDARLIAAAPVMLATLRDVAEYLDLKAQGFSRDYAPDHCINLTVNRQRVAVRAAIAATDGSTITGDCN